MSLKIKIAAIIGVLAFGFFGFYKYNQFQSNNITLQQEFRNLGALEAYNQRLTSYFDGKIKLEDYDGIESDFLDARIVFDALKKSNVDGVQKARERFLFLEETKDRYKKVSSQIAMSLLFLDKIVKESTTDKNEKTEIILEFLKFGVEEKKSFKDIDLFIEKYESSDELFLKHTKFIRHNLEILQSFILQKNS